MICGCTAGHRIAGIPLFPMSLCFDLLCISHNESVRQRYSRGKLYRPLKPHRIRLPILAILHRRLLHKSENIEEFIHFLRGKKGCSTNLVHRIPPYIIENLSSNDDLTYYKTKERILNFPSNHCSPCGASSKNSKPQHEANAVSSSNRKKDKKKNNGSSSSSDSGGNKCNWYRKHSQSTAER
jgi:hypothetical protein